MRLEGHVTYMVERRGVHRVLVGKSEGKKPLVRPKHRRKDNINMDFQEVGCGDMTGSMWLRIGTGVRHL